MRYPFWIINSTLSLLLIGGLLYIVFSKQVLPEREDIESITYVKPIRTKVSDINLRKIYEHDLFDTYKKETPTEDSKNRAMEAPTPPEPKKAEPIVWPKPEFLEPLAITLRGIMIVGNNQARNSVVIADKKTNRETLYHVGDILDDAQLLKIFKDKVVFLRSNGQQEVIYLREYDAKQDPAYALAEGWQDVIHKIGPDEYQVSPTEFSRRVINLAEFIDLLDITTVYSQGNVVGLRIGRTPEKSLGLSLGLQNKDIITTINDYKIPENPHKFDLYKQIIETQEGNTISITFIRNNKEQVLHYKLEDFIKPDETSVQKASQSMELMRRQQSPTRQQIDILKKHHEFAPTADEIRRKNRTNMMKATPTPKSLHSNFGRQST